MPTLTLRFDTAPGTDAAALAGQLQSGLATLPEVERSGAQPLGTRDFGVTAAAVMGFITVAPIVLNKASDLIDAIKRLIESSEGLRNAVVEIHGKRIPVAELKPSDIAPASPQS